MFTVDNAQKSPEQKDHDERCCLFALGSLGDAFQEDNVQHERRYYDNGVEDLHTPRVLMPRDVCTVCLKKDTAALAVPNRQSARMSKIKNSVLDQYGKV